MYGNLILFHTEHLFFNIVTIYGHTFLHSFYPFLHSIDEERFWFAADPFAHSRLNFGIR